MPRLGSAEGPLQDAPLDRIGVLEFIDQGGAVAAGHRLQQGGWGLGVWARVELLQQLAEAHLAGRLAAQRQLAAAPVGEVQQQQLRRTLQQGGNGLQQRPLGQRHPIAVGLGRRLGERAGVEVLAQVALGQHRGVVGHGAVEAIDPALHPLQPVGFGFEPVGLVLDAEAVQLGGGRRQLLLEGVSALAPEVHKPPPALGPQG